MQEKHKLLRLGGTRTPAATKVKKASEPAAGGKEDEAPVLLINTAKFLPEGFTGKHLARYYMADWINDWVKAALPSPPPNSGIGETKWADAVKDAGLEIYGEFTYILLSARTHTRNEILKSRKKVESGELYGECLSFISLMLGFLTTYRRETGRV